MRARLVLASRSPRRAELLNDAGYRFTIASAEVIELMTGELTARELTLVNAIRKGRAVLAATKPGTVVLAADTLVSWRGKILGKPADLKAARVILRSLSGETHVVYTSVFLAECSRGYFAFTERSEVTFLRLSENDIARYCRKIDPLDKAGAYAAQGEGACIIQRIDGSRSNVVGLPMEATAAALARFGIRAPSSQPRVSVPRAEQVRAAKR